MQNHGSFSCCVLWHDTWHNRPMAKDERLTCPSSPPKKALTSEYTKYTERLKSQQTLSHDGGFNLLSFIPVVNFQVGSIMGTRTQWISIAQLAHFRFCAPKLRVPEVLGGHPHGTRHFLMNIYMCYSCTIFCSYCILLVINYHQLQYVPMTS